MSKIVITQEQANALEIVKKNSSFEEIMGFMKTDFISIERKALNELTMETVANALINGYEVEQPKFQKGQVVKCGTHYGLRFGTFVSYEEINGEEVCWAYWDTYKYCSFDFSKNLRLATPEEAKKHNDMRLWSSIDRQIGEIKEGDAGVSKNGVAFKGCSSLKTLYSKNRLAYLYPEESRIELIAEEYKSQGETE